MPFVKTNFRLPTVTRADGTLAGYVQYNSNPVGDRYIWPAERIAIYQAQQAAKALAAKKKKMFSLFDLFGRSPAAPAARPGKKGVQTSAKGKTLGAGADNMPYGPPAPDDLIMQSGGVDPETMQFYSQPGNAPSSGVAAVMATQVINDAVNKVLENRNSKSPASQPQQSPSLVSGIPNSALYIGGGLVAAGVLVAMAKRNRR